MQDRIKEILSYAREKLEKINSSAECQNLRVELLGKSGKITELFRFMKEVPNEKKGEVGKMLNDAKLNVEEMISAKETFLANLELEKQVWEFNYQNTPNISQLHIVVDKADDKYIYLSSAFKVDNNDKNEPQVKCSLKNNICKYTRPSV